MYPRCGVVYTIEALCLTARVCITNTSRFIMLLDLCLSVAASWSLSLINQDLGNLIVCSSEHSLYRAFLKTTHQ